MLWTIARSILFALMIGLGAVAALQFTVTESEPSNACFDNGCDCRPNCFCAACECGKQSEACPCGR